MALAAMPPSVHSLGLVHLSFLAFLLYLGSGSHSDQMLVPFSPMNVFPNKILAHWILSQFFDFLKTWLHGDLCQQQLTCQERTKYSFAETIWENKLQRSNYFHCHASLFIKCMWKCFSRVVCNTKNLICISV